MPKLRLKQLDQDAATNGQVVTFNSGTGLWEPATAAGGSVDYDDIVTDAGVVVVDADNVVAIV